MRGKILDEEKHERKTEKIKIKYKKYEWIERKKKNSLIFLLCLCTPNTALMRARSVRSSKIKKIESVTKWYITQRSSACKWVAH